MKNKFGILALMAGFAMFSCSGEGENTEDTDTNDSTATNEEVVEDESELAFDGVDKGDYVLYGHSEIDADGSEATVDEMLQEFDGTGAFNRKVAVNIDEVCQKAGCWITFKDSENNSIRVFFRDHFTIPIETAQGTEAILYGSLNMDTISVDMQKHLLDDAKEAGQEVSQAEYDAITEDKIETTFDCESILVKK